MEEEKKFKNEIMIKEIDVEENAIVVMEETLTPALGGICGIGCGGAVCGLWC